MMYNVYIRLGSKVVILDKMQCISQNFSNVYTTSKCFIQKPWKRSDSSTRWSRVTYSISGLSQYWFMHSGLSHGCRQIILLSIIHARGRRFHKLWLLSHGNKPHLAPIKTGVRFTNHFSIVIPNRREKIYCNSFFLDMTVKLSCRVCKFRSDQFNVNYRNWEQSDISMEFELRWKIVGDPFRKSNRVVNHWWRFYL